MEKLNNTEVILAHDSFTQLGGAEKVIEVFHEMYPRSQVHALVLDADMRERYAGWDIRTSMLQAFYNLHPKLQHWLLLIPPVVEGMILPKAKIVLSSSSGFIKALRKPAGSVHINYCHTPTRFLWTSPDYVRQEVPVLLRPFVRLFLRFMRRWDFAAAQRVDYFIANSKEVQKRIKDIYHKDSIIIYPGIDLNFWHQTWQKQSYFLIAGRLQAHKQNKLIVEIFNEIGLPLHVIGVGRQERELRDMAKSNITFLGRVSDEALRDQYSGARAFIFPQLEDFGLMPLEAAACGTATLAYGQGGALETIVPGITGEFFGQRANADVAQAPGLPTEYSKDEIKQKILPWNEKKYSPEALRSQAEKFSKEKFKEQISEFINSKVSKN